MVFCYSSPNRQRQHKQELKIISGKICHFKNLFPAVHKTLQNAIQRQRQTDPCLGQRLLKRPYLSERLTLSLWAQCLTFLSAPKFPNGSPLSGFFCFVLEHSPRQLLETNTNIWPLRLSSGLTFTKDGEMTKDESSWLCGEEPQLNNFLMLTCTKISLTSHLKLHWKWLCYIIIHTYMILIHLRIWI